MIDVNEAYKIVLDHSRNFGTEKIALEKGIGRVLCEDWHCDRNLPPYDRVSMDGIAVNFASAKGTNPLKIVGVIAAGDERGTLEDANQCLEIMTGAVLPHGADTIIRYEDLTIENGYATINEHFEKNQNIHWEGKDRKKGELLVPKYTTLSASEIGVGASIGKYEIVVARFPKTIIISTGNELVEVDETPAPHQIRRGNIYRMQATLKHLGLEVNTAHLLDDKAEINSQLAIYLKQYELIILSGGVSKGKFDYLPDALEANGVKKHFHGAAQRPGKPLWFGSHSTGATVFALPGNPVSSFMCLTVYVIDWLRSSMGLSPTIRPNAMLTNAVSFKPDLTYFLEVKIDYDEHGHILATPQKGNGSGDLANLCRGDAFIRLPRGQEEFAEGEVYPIYWYR